MTHMASVAVLLSLVLLLSSSQVEACRRDDICIAIDISITIGTGRLAKTKLYGEEAITKIFPRSSSTAKFSVVSFSSSKVDSTPFSTDTASSLSAVRGIQLDSGAVSIVAGLNRCVELYNAQGSAKGTVLLIFVIGLGEGSNSALLNRAEQINNNAQISIIPVTMDDGGDDRGLFRIAANPDFVQRATKPSDADKFSKSCCQFFSHAHGDPHISGFDGSRFDFHGKDKAMYALYGRQGGDLVTTKISAVSALSNGAMRNLTYFREFGVQPAGSARTVRVSMQRCESTGRWWMGAEVDGKALKNFEQHDVFGVSTISEKHVRVSTRETEYTFKLIWPEEVDTAHLNIDVDLRRLPREGDHYHGVLGMTLNPHVGHKRDAILEESFDPVEREAVLSGRFKVDTLFPNWETGPRGPSSEVIPPKEKILGSTLETL